MNTQATKRIVIYGDSFVFGKVPGGTRFSATERFTGVTQNILGNDFEIIEEGMRGRTLSGENAFFPERDGLVQFGPIIASHLPFDLLIIVLGTNDLNSKGNKNDQDFREGLQQYREKIVYWQKALGIPFEYKILLVSPPKIIETDSYQAFGDIFRGSQLRVDQLPQVYEAAAKEFGFEFLDISTIVTSATEDGIHLNQVSNKAVGELLAEKIKTIL
ncbi:hypothetical protein IT418_01080 [bacterium]|nr:hypothetical protein [bacterium]